MSDKKICPIMSRPRQGDRVIDLFGEKELLFKSEDEMKEYGYFVVDGLPFSDMISCLCEKCMAWEPEVYGCANAGVINVCNDLDGDTCFSSCAGLAKQVQREGYCRLIPRE
jgi:hypothetical protein